MISRALPLTLAAALLLPAAPAPAGRGKITEEDRKWWAWQPVPAAVAVPSPAPGGTWAKNDLDAFILEKLRSAGLEPSPEAPRSVLVRRLYLDLTGLPPSADQVSAFVNDPAPDAWERLVDSLLASPRYGERWARHWLDLVRYADSDGYKADDYRPDAWRYRDYVIAAFNHDKPFDRFIMEQLAGDELFPDNPEALIATGYLRCGIYEYNNRDAAGQWSAILNDITDTTADVFLGMGLQCARCHDHKFDPLLQRDYFRLQAFFAPLQMPERREAVTAAERAAWQEKQTVWENATAAIRGLIAAIENPHRDRARQDAAEKFPPETRAILDKPAAERTPAEQPVFDLAWRQVTYEWEHLDGRIKGSEKEKLVALRKELAAFDSLKPAPLPTAMTASDTGGQSPPVTIPRREQEGSIEPGFPAILDPSPAVITAPGPQTTGRRSALARWMADPANPLTARVIVNRIWQQHFGRGLCATASDFGTLGDQPSHPALLDWLARRFMSRGWQFKDLHRLILTSAAWRQGTASPRAEHARITDPENRLLWRWNTRRMDSEQIRDTIFAVTGELDLSAGGPGTDASKPRRAIYTKVLRNVRDPLADAFDAPLQFNSTPVRDTTTTPAQSLLLANSRFITDRADAMAKRLTAAFAGDRELIDAAWQAATGRLPSSGEMEEALAFLQSQQEAAPPPPPGLITELMPQRSGRAAVLAPGSAQERIPVRDGACPLPEGDFTVEAVVLLRSVYPDGNVRTIVSRWNGDPARPGWSFGVTGQASRRKPQIPVLQLIGRNAAGVIVEEPVFSDIPLQLDRSYYLAAAVHSGTPGTVTFFVRDLANGDEPLRVSTVPHPVAQAVSADFPPVIGDTTGPARRQWDGLIDEIRLHRGCLTAETLSLKSPALTPATAACWQFEPSPGSSVDSVSLTESLRAATASANGGRTPAVADLCHTLLNSSAMLYME